MSRVAAPSINKREVTSLRTETGACALASIVVLLAGCTGVPAADEPTSSSPTSSSPSVLEPTTIREALASVEPGEQVRVQATLVTEDDVPFLCDSVAESDPVQCSEPSVEIVGAPLDDLGLTEHRSELAGGVDIVITIEGKTATFVGLGSGSETTTREP
jgi:hypothetical protein